MLVVEIPALTSFFFPLFSPPVSALFHPDHMGSPLPAWSFVSRSLVAGYDSQVPPSIYDQPGEGMWELRPDSCVKRCLRECGLWERNCVFIVSARDMISWLLSRQLCLSILLSASCPVWQVSGVSYDGWLFLPDLVCSVFRWAFPLNQIAPVVNIPALILTVMRTSMPSSTVSCRHPVQMLLSVPFCFKDLSYICSQQSQFFSVVMYWNILEQMKFLSSSLLSVSSGSDSGVETHRVFQYLFSITEKLSVSLKSKTRFLWGFWVCISLSA